MSILIIDFTRFKLSYCVKLPVLALSYGKDLDIVLDLDINPSCPFFKPVTSVAVRISASLVSLKKNNLVLFFWKRNILYFTMLS